MKGYRVVTYTSKNDFYVLNVDKSLSKEGEDQGIIAGNIESDEDDALSKSQDSATANKKKKKKLRVTTIDTLQLNIAQKQFTSISKS